MKSSSDRRLPEQSATELLLAMGLFLATVLLLWPQRDFVSMNPDEGIVLQGAARILRGEVPYRDFFSFYTPFSYFWLALAFKIFGQSLTVARTTLLIYGGLFSALTYLLARRIASRRAAIFAAYLVLAVWPFRFFVLHNWDSTVWTLLGFYCAVRLLDSPRLVWGFMTGWFVSLALLTEQSKGAGLLIGMSLAFFIIVSRRRSAAVHDEGGSGSLGWKIIGEHWIAMGIGFALPLAVAVSYLATQHAFGAAFSAWLWPLRHYSAANATPFGFSVPLADAREMLRSAGGNWLSAGVTATFIAALIAIPTLPLIAFLSALLSFRQTGAASGVWDFRHRVLAASTTAGLLVSVFVTRRPDMSHMIYLAPICFFLLPGLPAWGTPGSAPRTVTNGGFASAGVLGKWITAMGVALFVLVSVFALAVQWNGLVAREVVRTRRGIIRMGTRDEALDYIQAHVPEGQKLCVHPYSPLYSFLSGTYSPTRFEYLQAGMHTPQQFQEAARELSLDPSVPVLLEVNFASSKLTSIWPATPPHAVAVDAVAEYVMSHYRVCRVLTGGSADSTFLFMTRSGQQPDRVSSPPR